MKVAMINDCAFVGETLIKYLPSHIDIAHIKRTRKLLDKTFKIAWKILRAKGDIYHCHYLLQDCWLTLKFGKHPVVGHAHGTDLRDVVKGKKLGWIVKYNLEHCDKILVAQPTILEVAKEFNDTAEYFPIPYDPKLFYSAPLITGRKIKRVFMASPQDFRVKGSDKLLHALSLVKIPLKAVDIRYGRDAKRAEKLAKDLGLDVQFMNRVPHDCMNQMYWGSDIVLGSFGVGQLDTVAIEAMACGRPVVHHLQDEYFPSCPLRSYLSVEEVKEDIEKLLHKKDALRRVEDQLDYVRKVHSAEVLAKRLLQLYLQVILNTQELIRER
ncbi:MAG: glycosyltransferase [Candidatus Hodarchaeota archaeon]